MHHRSYARLLRTLPPTARRGAIVLMLVQDGIDVAQTMAHYRDAGVRTRIALGPSPSPDVPCTDSAPFDCHAPGAMAAAANALMRAVPGAWIIPCWNGERLMWPHGDTRPLPDLFSFLEDERRYVLGGVVLDSYRARPHAPHRPDASQWRIDRIGYDQRDGAIHGGLRARIGPPCPAAGRPLNRPLALKARKGVRLLADGTCNDPEMNTLHASYHHSPTAALISPRVFAWMAAQPAHHVRDTPLIWQGSEPLGGTARQLWDLGFIAPGQWV